MADMKFGDPDILTLCIAARILPKSLVIVIFTSGLLSASLCEVEVHFPCKSHDANSALGIGLRFRAKEKVDSI
jgi:hypothetical protein